MLALSPEQVRRLRTRAQHLQPRAPRVALADTIRSVVGIQAQSHPAMLLALRARVDGLTMDDTAGAIRARHHLVRTWMMRGTLHLSMAEDARWLVALLGPLFIPAGRRRRLELGLDDQTSARGVEEIRSTLSQQGAMTRDELLAALTARGVPLERKSQATIHLIGLAALEGILCYGPNTDDGKETFRLFEDWAGRLATQPTESALAELARRYVRGYGPASVRDLAAWSGLPMPTVRQAWNLISAGEDFIEASIGDLAVLVATSEVKDLKEQATPSPVVRLLPAFDTYILGYSLRHLLVRPEFQSEVYHGGQTVPVVLMDGQAIGVWRYKRQGKRLAITVQAFNSFGSDAKHLIAEEVSDIGRFWEMPVSLHIEQG